MQLKLSRFIPTLALILLQTLTISNYLLPVSSSPVRSSGVEQGQGTDQQLDRLLDPVYQSEQDNQLESKRVFAKSVYNTVIRVTTTPCSAGSQRVKEGGPCVTRYTGSGPVLDEEFQLSILKGITSLGGLGGGRRTSHNKNRNRHRTTTTTPIPPTTTLEPEPSTGNDEEPLPTESPPPEFEDVKKVGNVEILDIEVDSSHTELDPNPIRPELSPPAPVSSSVITPQPMTVSIPAPQPGPRPMSTLTSTSTSVSTSNNGSNTENDETKNSASLSPLTIIQPIIELSSPTFSSPVPGTGAGIKDDEDGEPTTETIIDFSTTMMTLLKEEDDSINVSFDVVPTEGIQRDEDIETDTTIQPSMLMVGQNVMVSQEDEDKGRTTNNLKIIETMQDPDPVTFQDSKLESVEMSGDSLDRTLSENASQKGQPNPEGNLSQTHFFRTESLNPIGSSSVLTSLEITPAPVTSLVIPLLPQPQDTREHLPEASSSAVTITILKTSSNFTEGNETKVGMIDGNTRLPDLNPASEPQQLSQDVKSSEEFSPPLPSLIQIDDFEMEPITPVEEIRPQQGQRSPSSPTLMTFEDVDVEPGVEEDVNDQPLKNEDELVTNPDSGETLHFANTDPSPASPEPEAPTSLAQEILSKLRPISDLSKIPRSSQSQETSFPATLPQSQKRWRFPPEVILDEVESDLRMGPSDEVRSRQAELEIDHSHHRSRSRNRARSSESETLSTSSLILPSHHHHPDPQERSRSRLRSMTSKEGEGGGHSEETSNFFGTPSTGFAHTFPKALVGPTGPLDYTRLGDNYRRFRVF